MELCAQRGSMFIRRSYRSNEFQQFLRSSRGWTNERLPKSAHTLSRTRPSHKIKFQLKLNCYYYQRIERWPSLARSTEQTEKRIYIIAYLIVGFERIAFISSILLCFFSFISSISLTNITCLRF